MYFILFANCIPVKGFSRSTICDLSRNDYILVPNEIVDILLELRSITLDALLRQYDAQDQQSINEWIFLLEDREMGFFCEENDIMAFPEMSMEWEWPGLISNAVIDVDKNSTHDFSNIFSKLQDVHCKAIQLRFFCEVSPKKIAYILNKASNKDFYSIVLTLKFRIDLLKFILKNEKKYAITHIEFYDMQEEDLRSMDVDFENSNISLTYTEQVTMDDTHCGVVSKEQFVLNIPHFTESQNFNTCLNRKVGINSNGEIKNCPSSIEVYGNINDHSLTNIVKSDSFQRLWKIKKDQIEICRDCEYRHICTDCRAFLKNEENMFSKPLKCNYDPYQNVWMK